MKTRLRLWIARRVLRFWLRLVGHDPASPVMVLPPGATVRGVGIQHEGEPPMLIQKAGRA